MVRGLSDAAIERVLAERERAPFDDIEDLARRARLEQRDLQALVGANALAPLAGHRHNAMWQASALTPLPEVLESARFAEAALMLPAPSEGEDIAKDYRSVGLSMGRHPLALLREPLARLRVTDAETLHDFPHGRLARAAGLVTHRQRPETAKGVIFVTLEDDTGTVNVIVWPAVFERYRPAVLGAQLMVVYGVWQRDEDSGGQVTHLVAQRVEDRSALLGRLTRAELPLPSRDFH
jgi:error-prone DNA polymerase